MNKKITIRLLCTLITITSCRQDATSQAQQKEPEESQISFNSFIEWCQQKSTLPKETKHTVEVLLKKAGTQDCLEI